MNTTAIEVAAHDDGTFRLMIGGRARGTFTEKAAADEAAVPARHAYAAGRKDQRVETSTLLKGLIAG